MPVAVVSADKDLQDTIQSLDKFKLIGVIDRNPDVEIGNVKWLGADEDRDRIYKEYQGLTFVIALDPCRSKKKLCGYYGIDVLSTVIAKDSYISDSVQLGQGAIVQRGVKIMPDVNIGIACKININATIHHDSKVGDYCTIAPGAQLLGNVVLDNEVFVGAGAVILPGVYVGVGAIIGAGAVVTKDVSAHETVVGVPARRHSISK